MSIGAVILAGGKSRRMGRNKAGLQVEKESFLERISGELNEFDERLLSISENCNYSLDGYIVVRDLYLNYGPMAGLYAALASCRSEALLVVPCDVPLYRRELGKYLIECLTPDYDAVIAVTRDGRKHPFCGVYRKEVAKLLESQMNAGHRCILDAFSQMRLYCAELKDTSFPDKYLINVNTPEEYVALYNSVWGQTV